MDPQYYIQQGVRRAVAAREAGLTEIPARLVEAGKPDMMLRVALTQLHSPKRQIARDYRYIRDSEYPTQVLKTEPPPIAIEPLGAPGQSSAIPLAQVLLC
jgi:hypothetical protein